MLVGVGAPYLIDYLSGGQTIGFVVSLFCWAAGAGLLFFGHTHDRRELRKWKIPVVVCLALLAVGGSGWRLFRRKKPQPRQNVSMPAPSAGPPTVAGAKPHVATEPPKAAHPAPAPAVPHISVRYRFGVLPIAIQPGETVWIFALENDKSIKSGFLGNTTGVLRLWPINKPTRPPVTIGIAKINTTQLVLNFSMEFAFNGIAHPFHADVLRPDKPQTIYFVNETQTDFFISFPDSGTFELEGKPQRLAVTIPLDGVESYFLPSLETVLPSPLKWSGDRLLDESGQPAQ